MTPTEMDRLLINHIADMEDGAKRLNRLSGEISKAMDELLAKWAESNNWVVSGIWDEDDYSFAPAEWRRSDDEWLAHFSLALNAAPRGTVYADDQFWLASLCGEGSRTYGFRFYQNEFGNSPWRKFIRGRAETLQGTRFIFDDEPSFFLPVRVDKDRLAAAVGDEAIDDGLSPITEALDYVKANWQRFEELRQEMTRMQGGA